MDNPITSAPIDEQDGTPSKEAQPDNTTTHSSSKSVSLHDSNTLLQGLTLSPWQPDGRYLDEMEDDDVLLSSLDPAFPQVLTISNKMTCSLCGCNFDNREQQTEHYKLDWHRFNLKQRIIGNKAVTMEMFEDMSGDISSLSGSESSCQSDNDIDEEPNSAGQRHVFALHQSQNNTDDSVAIKQRTFPRVFFRNSEGQLISVHRCILHGKKNVPSTQSQLIAMATRLSNNPTWAMVMTGGGHFAAAVYRGNEMIAHKTFHRYTVRAKRGTAQGMRDGQQGGNQPKSAGASLRRYNEAALTQDIQDLLESWKDKLSTCQRIFLRAPTYNRAAFFGGKTPSFKKDDVRICSIPFPTRRATLKELNRIHGVLSNVQCYGNAEEAETRLSQMFSSKSKKARSRHDKSVVVETDDTAPDSAAETTPKFPVAINGEESTDEEDDITLVYEEVEISTQHLKEFDSDCSPKRRPRRKKKKNTGNESQNDTNANESEGDKMTNDLYSACKSGNIDKLRTLLSEISKSGNTGLSSANQDDNNSVNKSDKCLAQNLEDTSDVCNEIVPTTDVHGDDAQNKMTTKESIEDEHGTPSDIVTAFASSDNASIPRTQNNESETKSHSTEPNVKPESETVLESNASGVTDDDAVANVLNGPIDKKGSTLLHVAAVSGHLPVIWLLLESGADPSLRNKKGQPPYLLSANKEIRNEFRRFLASHPQRYDYAAAQIPGPLTTDMEEERAKKAADKKKAQRKIKQAKQKEQKEEEKKKAAAREEKLRYAALSEREKRALAAESRLVKQSHATNTNISGPRCWLCGETLMGKMPFEYSNWKFCSMKCLRQHKQQQQQ